MSIVDKRFNEKYGLLRLLKVYVELDAMTMESTVPRDPFPEVQRKKCGPIPNLAPNQKAEYVLTRLNHRLDKVAEDAEYDKDAIQHLEKCALCGALIPYTLGECPFCKHDR